MGYRGAAAQLGLEPDITAFGKIIGGGLPIGAIAGRREIMAVFDPSKGKPAVAHAGTFTANPLSMVAGAAKSEEHTSELQSLMRISYAVFCLKKKKKVQTSPT